MPSGLLNIQQDGSFRLDSPVVFEQACHVTRLVSWGGTSVKYRTGRSWAQNMGWDTACLAIGMEAKEMSLKTVYKIIRKHRV